MSAWWDPKKRQAERDNAIAVNLEVLKGVKALEEAPDNIGKALTSELAEKAGATVTLKNDIKDHNKAYKKKFEEKDKAASKKESHEITHQAAMEHAAMTGKAYENAVANDAKLARDLKEMEKKKNQLPLLLESAEEEEELMKNAAEDILGFMSLPRSKRILGSESGASTELIAGELGCENCHQVFDLIYGTLHSKMNRLFNLGVDFDDITLSTRPHIKLLRRAIITVCFPNDIHPDVRKKLKKQVSPSHMHEVTKGLWEDDMEDEENNKKRKADGMSAEALAKAFTPEKLQEAISIATARSSKRLKLGASTDSPSISNSTIVTDGGSAYTTPGHVMFKRAGEDIEEGVEET
jgi:hypothetical protein